MSENVWVKSFKLIYDTYIIVFINSPLMQRRQADPGRKCRSWGKSWTDRNQTWTVGRWRPLLAVRHVTLLLVAEMASRRQFKVPCLASRYANKVALKAIILYYCTAGGIWAWMRMLDALLYSAEVHNVMWTITLPLSQKAGHGVWSDFLYFNQIFHFSDFCKLPFTKMKKCEIRN